jgi:hypothetical protein
MAHLIDRKIAQGQARLVEKNILRRIKCGDHALKENSKSEIRNPKQNLNPKSQTHG